MPEESENRCCKVEKGALIYGILNLILWSCILLVEIGMLFYCFYGSTGPCSNNSHVLFVYILMEAFVIPPTVVIIPFTILLICGVCKKKPGLILTYFIFGIVLLVLAATGSVYMLVQGPLVAGILLLIIFLIYSLPLIMVFRAYKKLKSGRVYDQCNKLQKGRDQEEKQDFRLRGYQEYDSIQ